MFNSLSLILALVGSSTILVNAAPVNAPPLEPRAVTIPTSSVRGRTTTTTRAASKRSTTNSNKVTTSSTSTTTATTTKTATASPTPGGMHTGVATWFTQDDLAGACGFYNLDSTPLVALQYTLYGNMDTVSQYCGRYVNITNTDNGKQVIAIVADACPGCEGSYGLDLSLGAFDLVGDRDTGVLPINWSFLPTTYKPTFVTPTLTGPTPAATTVKKTTTSTTPVRTTTTSTGSQIPLTTISTSDRIVRSISSATTKTTVTVNKTSTTVKRSATPTSTWVDARIRQQGITAFQATRKGTNNNAIVSWFHTTSSTDSTNGQSWCGFPYNDNTPGFAPSLKQMLANFGGNYAKAATAFCGMEAQITSRSGKVITLVIADAFDDRWVRTPNSIDVVYNSFSNFNGARTKDKNVVQTGASWKFTGRRDLRYKFRGVGAA